MSQTAMAPPAALFTQMTDKVSLNSMLDACPIAKHPEKMFAASIARGVCAVSCFFVPLQVARSEAYGPKNPYAAELAPTVAPAGVPQDLADAVGRSLATYPSIASAQSALKATQSDIKAAKWQRFPSLSIEGLTFAGGNKFASSSNVGVNVIVDQPVWTGGRITNNIVRAKALSHVAQAELDETSFTLALSVVQSYFEMVRTARRNAILVRGQQNLAELSSSIGRRVDQEVSPKADLILANSRVAQAAQDTELNQAQFYAARERFRQLVGDPTATLTRLPTYDVDLPKADPAQSFAEAQACDPKRRRLIAETDAARAETKVARASLFPQLSAQFSQNEITGSRVGLVLRQQTNGGLSQLSAVTSARLRADSSAFQVQVTERETREALALDIVENISSRQRALSNVLATTASQEVTESYKRQFVAGRRTWLDVVNAVREAISAELGQVESENSAIASNARILLRTCRWQPEGPKS